MLVISKSVIDLNNCENKIYSIFKIEFLLPSYIKYQMLEIHTQTDDTQEQILIDSMADMKKQYDISQEKKEAMRVHYESVIDRYIISENYIKEHYETIIDNNIKVLETIKTITRMNIIIYMILLKMVFLLM